MSASRADLPPAGDPIARTNKVSTALAGLWHSPLPGLVPWIIMAVIAGPGRHELAVLLALGVALFTIYLKYLGGSRRFKALELFDVTYFALLAALGVVASAGLETWIEKWSGEISSLALTTFAVGTIIARVPFTIQYAKEEAPEEYWDTPVFIHINYVLTWVWAGSFAVSATTGFIDDVYLHTDNFWTAWIIPIGGTVFALAFTEWYPDRASAKALIAVGEPTDPPPPLLTLFESFPPFITIVGVAMLVTDEHPLWLSYTLMGAGIALGVVMRKRAA
jgi:hypothetical protein